MEKTEKIINEFEHFIQEYDRDIGLTNHDSEVLKGALTLLKERKPRVMTLDEVLSATKYSTHLFTECEKESQWVRYGTALFFNQAIYRKNPSESECKIAFMFHSEGEAYVRQWHIFYKDYGKTWRCWTSRPTDEQRKATPWVA